MANTSTFDGPRPARLDERAKLLAMINEVFRTSQGRAPTIELDWGHVYEPENLANVMVVSDPAAEDKIVASTAVWVSEVTINDVRLRVGGINCVGTLSDYRRHGFGSQVMMAAQQRMAALQCHVGLLSTGITNWYRRLGWEEAGSQCAYRLNRGNIALLPPLRVGLTMRVIDARQESLDAELGAHLVRLHHNGRLGAARTVSRFLQLTRARAVEHVVVAEAAGVPVAYLLVREATIIEWAGAAEDVAGLARAYFEHVDDPNISTSQRGSDGRPAFLRTLTLHTPGWQHELPMLLNALRIPYSIEYVGMIYLIDPQAILEAYARSDERLAGVRVQREGDGFVLHDRDHALRVDRQQLTKLFFGPERVSATLSPAFPLPFWQWILERV